MGSRADILEKIKANKPDTITLPNLDLNVFDEGLNLVEEFVKKVEVVGGNVISISSYEDILKKIKILYPDTKVSFSSLENSEEFNTISVEAISKPHELEDLDVLVLESNLGVAENGAIWLDDSKSPLRILPFITKHLVLIIDKKSLVPYMHQAYKKIEGFNFGVFISGPSKTADIEQSLVIGAHGALSLTVFLRK